jgi:hypothetical protein
MKTVDKSNDKQIVLKVVEEINTKPLINKRSYKSYLIEISKDIELDKIIFERKSRYVITKTIYVKLHKEDIDVEDLSKTKAYFRAKMTLRLAGDKV